MPDSVQAFLDELQDLGCAPLLRSFTDSVCGLDPEVQPELAAFGIRFRYQGELLCEVSVFGELFIVRVGREQAIEYRVRSRAVALEALDRILREYGVLLEATNLMAAETPAGIPVPPQGG
jgi:hypothetical protein